MTKLKNIAPGSRSIWSATEGMVEFAPGQSREVDLGDDDYPAEWFEEDAGDEEVEEAEVPHVNLDTQTVAELKGIAEAEGIDLGDAKRKDDIIAAITLAREAAE